MKRIAITGLGLVTPLGLTVQETWDNMLAGKSGIGNITFYDTIRFEVKIAGEVKVFEIKQHLPPEAHKAARSRMHRHANLATRATFEALAQSGLVIDEENADLVGVAIGTGGGSLDRVAEITRIIDNPERGPSKVSPFEAAMMMPNAAATRIAQFLGAKGGSLALSAACATGNDSIGYASMMITTGRTKVMIAGGTEALISPLTNATFTQAQALTTAFNHIPEAASRPLDRDRSGFVWSEGAGIVILEEEEFARKRGAEILGWLEGWWSTNDAFHETAPDGIGSRKAMIGAIRDAGLNPADIDFINLHGTSTEVGDKTETRAIKEVFGEKLGTVMPVTANKSQLGHIIGATSAVEAVISMLMLKHGIVPATINLDNKDPECDLNALKEVREMRLTHGLSNGFGFGGMNSSIVLGRA